MATIRRARTVIRDRLPRAIVRTALLAACAGGFAFASSAPATTPTRAQAASSHTTSPPARRKRHARHFAATRHHRALRKTPTAASGACANTQLRPNRRNLALIRAATLCLVNRERTSRGEAALKPNWHLRRSAQAHSSDMASGDYFAHDSRNGSTPLARMRAAGYIANSHLGYAVGENIAWATLGLSTPKAIVAGWMASPGHRANILDATYHDTGLGISPHPLSSLARGQRGAIYTQDFGRIIAP